MSVKGFRHWIVNTGRRASVLLVIVCCALPSAKTWASPTESELRAAVIVAIMRFTSWPKAATDAPPHIRVCLLGAPNSTSHLLRVSGQQKVAGRVLQVNELVGPEIGNCEVLVLGAEFSREGFAALMLAADQHSILTVCDGCDSSRNEDTIIYLTLRKQRVNFEVNLAKAKSNGLALDAQLLELASVVRK